MDEREEITATKLIAFFGVLFMIADAIALFYASRGTEIFILYGILEIVFAFVLFISLDLIDFKVIKIPYEWWILSIIGAVLIVFGVLYYDDLGYEYTYFSCILVLMAGILEFLLQKKYYKASEIMLLLGSAFAIYDCFVIFLSTGNAIFEDIWITNAVFGLILVILLLLMIQNWIDIKIPFAWWTVLTVGFVIFMWVSPNALSLGIPEGYPIAGFGGMIIFIALILLFLGF